MWIQKVWRLFKTRRLLEEIRCSFSSSLSHILAHISMAVIDFVKELVVFTFYKGIFVVKQPPKRVLLKGVLTMFDNPMILQYFSKILQK